VLVLSAYIASDDVRISASANAPTHSIAHNVARIIDNITPSATDLGVW